MHRTSVRADGTVPLGEAAERLGFRPGTPVDVIVTRAGTLILCLDDTPALDVPYTKSIATVTATQRALREGRGL